MNESVLDQLCEDGFVLVHDACEPELVTRLLDAATREAKATRAALGDKEIGIGSAAGYEEIVQRSPGRWDVPFNPHEIGLADDDMPLLPLARAALGDDAEFWVAGIISSEPGSPDQFWHSDSPHETAEHLPPNVVTVLLALHEVPMEMGPTEFAIGSHRLTNHLVNPSLVVDQLIYQYEGTTRESVVEGTPDFVPEAWTSALPAGSCLAFDDRVLHRGMANRSTETRHIAYFSYRRHGYDTDTYYESSRSITDD